MVFENVFEVMVEINSKYCSKKKKKKEEEEEEEEELFNNL